MRYKAKIYLQINTNFKLFSSIIQKRKGLNSMQKCVLNFEILKLLKTQLVVTHNWIYNVVLLKYTLR